MVLELFEVTNCGLKDVTSVMKDIIGKLRKLIREQKYTISMHANEEMSDDDLMAVDVEQAILTGHVLTRLTDDPRGPRYNVLGSSTDGTRIRVVCRITSGERIIIMAVYVLEE